MEHQVVKVPHHEVVVALGRAQIGGVGCIDPQQHVAIQQHGEQRLAQCALASPQRLDRSRRRQRRDRGGDLRIADPDKRRSARRFQHDVVAAPPQIGKSRQHDQIGRAELSHLRPVVGSLRFDDDRIRSTMFAAGGFAHDVFEKTAPGQAADHQFDLLVDRALSRKRGKWQAAMQTLRALTCVSAELAEVGRLAIKVGCEPSTRRRHQADARKQPSRHERLRRAACFAVLPGSFRQLFCRRLLFAALRSGFP